MKKIVTLLFFFLMIFAVIIILKKAKDERSDINTEKYTEDNTVYKESYEVEGDEEKSDGNESEYESVDTKKMKETYKVEKKEETGDKIVEKLEEGADEDVSKYEIINKKETYEEETWDKAIGKGKDGIDENFKENIELSKEKITEIDEVIENDDFTQYSLNKELKEKLYIKIVEGEAVLDYFDEAGIDAFEFQSTIDEMAEIQEYIIPEEMTKEEYKKTIEILKELLKNLEEIAKELIPGEDIAMVEEMISGAKIVAEEAATN